MERDSALHMVAKHCSRDQSSVFPPQERRRLQSCCTQHCQSFLGNPQQIAPYSCRKIFLGVRAWHGFLECAESIPKQCTWLDLASAGAVAPRGSGQVWHHHPAPIHGSHAQLLQSLQLNLRRDCTLISPKFWSWAPCLINAASLPSPPSSLQPSSSSSSSSSLLLPT